MSMGLVENIVHSRVKNSFGYIYHTDFTAHVFFICVSIVYLRREFLTYLEILGLVLIAFLCYKFCGTICNCFCLLLTAGCSLIIKTLQKYKNTSKWWIKCYNSFASLMLSSYIVLPALSLVLTFTYSKENAFSVWADRALHNRLHLGRNGLDQYGVSLWGQPVVMRGYGGTSEKVTDYFFLDSSYINVLIRMGLVVFCVVLCWMFINSYHAYKEQDIILLLALSLIAIQCFEEHHLMEMAYNPFLFLITSKRREIAKDS